MRLHGFRIDLVTLYSSQGKHTHTDECTLAALSLAASET